MCSVCDVCVFQRPPVLCIVLRYVIIAQILTFQVPTMSSSARFGKLKRVKVQRFSLDRYLDKLALPKQIHGKESSTQSWY